MLLKQAVRVKLVTGYVTNIHWWDETNTWGLHAKHYFTPASSSGRFQKWHGHKEVSSSAFWECVLCMSGREKLWPQSPKRGLRNKQKVAAATGRKQSMTRPDHPDCYGMFDICERPCVTTQQHSSSSCFHHRHLHSWTGNLHVALKNVVSLMKRDGSSNKLLGLSSLAGIRKVVRVDGKMGTGQYWKRKWLKAAKDWRVRRPAEQQPWTHSCWAP